MPHQFHVQEVLDPAADGCASIQEAQSHPTAPTPVPGLTQQEPVLGERAAEYARSLVWLPATRASRHFAERWKKLNENLQPVLAAIDSGPADNDVAGEEQRWLYENAGLLRSAAARLQEAEGTLTRIAHVRGPDLEVDPRVIAVAEDLLPALDYRFVDSEFSAYLRAFQSVVVLNLDELWALVPALKLVLLEQTLTLALRVLAKEKQEEVRGIAACIQSLREIEQAPWKELLEPLIVFDQVLRRDPAGAYPRMDVESREMYRREVVKLAACSDYSEVEIAEMALSLALESGRHPETDPRLSARRSHVGYYLIAEGREQLYRHARVRLPLHDRWQAFLRRYPDEFYLTGIELLTVAMVLGILWRGEFNSLSTAFFVALALVLPCSQAAVEILNFLTTSFLTPRILPKLDLRDGIPEDCTTMVVVPTLLLNENQVRRLVNELEVRYVGNMSPNLHFALLTDLADSAEQPREDDPLIELCGNLIRDLNQKYAGKGGGSFAMFHRHRAYNPREGVWMGWERKRGKLLDFNRLILGHYDSFPYKVGDLSLVPRIRYVLTLDFDTQLPRGAARRLIGALAHPLCQAIVDPERNLVTQGFGILQPRVGVSIQSTAQSRLASIYSGKTGFDIYTRAVSDVYQDLYGEGTFAGKGLYEVHTLHRVLDHRFPRNTILSHDLIEGAYTRAGLVSDVEVIDHYPSHYSAYTRRKHRWVRGDWQIVEWLFGRVPDESGRRVPNPISLISRWKILDNLRRSVVEPATFLLLLLAWMFLPGRPSYWTLITLGILFLPPCFQFVFGLLRATLARSLASLGDAFVSFGTGLVSVGLTLAFLAHNAAVSTDAIWRTLYRRLVSRQRLLEWETAAQAEQGTHKRTPVDLYLIWTPVLALMIAAAVFFVRRPALPAALPILALWAGSKLISFWLDRPPRPQHQTLLKKDELFLRQAALRTWRYFAEFSTEEHNWLVPDNVWESPSKVVPRISPTNLGFLLNARQVACEFGYLTVPEFTEQMQQTLDTMARLQSHRGHLFNWYNTRTLSPDFPLFVSSVDNGNLAASLITLKNGCMALLQRPLLSPALLAGYEDHLRILMDLRLLSRRAARSFIRSSRGQENRPLPRRLLALASELPIQENKTAKETMASDAQWFTAQCRLRGEWVRRLLRDYLPWWLPEFDSLRNALQFEDGTEELPLAHLPAHVRNVQTMLEESLAQDQEKISSEGDRAKAKHLLTLLAGAHLRSVRLVSDLQGIAAGAERWISNMDFGFLLDRRRKLLSIGYDVDGAKLHSACYDLLASEARIASFVAIAKGEIPQESWFALGRSYAPAQQKATLISWTGTMFEYLMPAIWMRSYPDTLLRRSMEGAVHAQQAYAAEKRIPWGISESACAAMDDAGNYQYHAFGVPQLAVQDGEPQRLVVAPYATAMALPVDPLAALKNLRHMARNGWVGAYGFYEAADFTSNPGGTGRRGPRPKLVTSWMAHHQGMSLLSMANFLRGDIVQQWFHNDARVRATELLLQERPIVRRAKWAWSMLRPQLPARTPVATPSKLSLGGLAHSG